MYAHQITSTVADAHRQDLIAEARAYRLGRASRSAAQPRRETTTFAFRLRVAFAR
jgi:hypothetical protein